MSTGDDYDYGKQRVWGTIGFGLTAFVAGCIVNIYSDTVVITYTPAVAVMIFFSLCDLFSCVKLKVNKISTNIGQLICKFVVVCSCSYL